MQKKYYYTLKEIILGLRKEYLTHQQKLQALKNCCDIDAKKVVDYDFRLYQPSQLKPKLLCEYTPKQNKVQKALTDIRKKRGFYIYGQHTSGLVTDNNWYYFKDPKYPVHIKSDSRAEFSRYASSLLEDEFSNEIKSEYIERYCSDVNGALTIDSMSVDLFIREKSSNIPRSSILYDSKEYVLQFESYDEPMNRQSLEAALNITFPSKELNDYHVKTISNSEESEKPLYLEEFDSCSKAKFDIQDQGNQYVLRRL